MRSLVLVEIGEAFQNIPDRSERVKSQSGFAYSALHVLFSSSGFCDDATQISEAFEIFQILAL